jgi:hypothetical protein
VKATVSVCEPTPNIVPAAGEYVKVPATVEVAFRCVALTGVP